MTIHQETAEDILQRRIRLLTKQYEEAVSQGDYRLADRIRETLDSLIKES
jgi:cysteinyl-tRNA synthetase